MQNSRENPVDPMQRAHALAQAGNLAGAAQACRDVLARVPSHVYALFMLGTIEGEQRHFDEAEKLLGQAVKLSPNTPEILTSYGNILLELKRAKDAVNVLDKAIALQPQNQNALIYRGLALVETGKPEQALKDFDRVLVMAPQSIFALHNRANVLIQMDRHAEAKRSVEALLRIDPRHVPAIANLAHILLREKKFTEALAAADRALGFDPNNPDLWNGRGVVLRRLNRFDESLASFDKAIQLHPDSTASHLSLGNLQSERGQYEAALASYEKAIALKPDLAAAYLNVGNVRMEQNRLEDALQWCEKALAAQAEYAPAMLLRGNILLHLGRLKESLTAYDAAVRMSPNYHEGHYHRGSTLLLMGRFQEGWRDFEHRWMVEDCGFDRPTLQGREWTGEPLNGRSIVIYSEQGLGDSIQFARFLPLLARMGARVTFLCHAHLMRLFKSLSPEIELTAFVDGGRRFDFQCALMSLPLHLGTTLETIPNAAPYLIAEPELVARWRARIGAQGFKVGLCWQGNPVGKIDKGRSIPLEKYRPLAAVPGVRLISLQKNHGLEQLQDLSDEMQIEILDAFDSGDDAFVDTAAIMQSLDLVITSDTATPHLAGALGRPAWVALKQVPDWRWMLERNDSPWYRSLRLYRQSAPEDWDTVFAAMAEDLQRLVRRDA